MGRYRALVDLGEVSKANVCNNLSALSNSSMEQMLEKWPPIRYQVSDRSESSSGTKCAHIGPSSDYMSEEDGMGQMLCLVVLTVDENSENWVISSLSDKRSLDSTDEVAHYIQLIYKPIG